MQVVEKNGRPVRTRTADLYRVKCPTIQHFEQLASRPGPAKYVEIRVSQSFNRTAVVSLPDYLHGRSMLRALQADFAF